MSNPFSLVEASYRARRRARHPFAALGRGGGRARAAGKSGGARHSFKFPLNFADRENLAFMSAAHSFRAGLLKGLKGEAMNATVSDKPAGLPVRLKERRLTKRVQRVWRAKTGAGSAADGAAEAVGVLPAWRDISAGDLGEDWPFCFAVDLRLSDASPYFIYLGEALWRFSGLYLSSRERWETALIDLAAAKMDEAALNKAPVGYVGNLRLDDGRRVVFRSILLPLADNGVDVTHVFGAANGRGP